MSGARRRALALFSALEVTMIYQRRLLTYASPETFSALVDT
jgi:hypothetical protein